MFDRSPRNFMDGDIQFCISVPYSYKTIAVWFIFCKQAMEENEVKSKSIEIYGEIQHHCTNPWSTSYTLCE